MQVGLTDISYTVDPTGFLVQSRTLTFDVFLEIARMVVLHLFICSSVQTRLVCFLNITYI